MADFDTALKLTLENEGLYSNDPDDPGLETLKGISRKNWPNWNGWAMIDHLKVHRSFPDILDDNSDLQVKVSYFYKTNFWNSIKGDQIANQGVANSIFDFGVNAGIGTGARLAQEVVGAKTDGMIGPQSIAAINGFNPDHFLAAFTVAKIAHYVIIVNKRTTSRKYFYGWVIRALKFNTV